MKLNMNMNMNMTMNEPEKRGRKPGISLNGDRMVESMGGSHRHI